MQVVLRGYRYVCAEVNADIPLSFARIADGLGRDHGPEKRQDFWKLFVRAKNFPHVDVRSHAIMLPTIAAAI
jgi:hypothetical protein